MNENEQNPIVAMAMKIRASRDLAAAVDSATSVTSTAGTDAEESFAALGEVLAIGSKRLNSILGKNGITFVRLEKPIRFRLRFGEKRISLDLDRSQQLVIIKGEGFEGEYQFDVGASLPSLINLSKLSNDPGYGEAITGTSLLKAIAADAELPRPAHLDVPPLQL